MCTFGVLGLSCERIPAKVIVKQLRPKKQILSTRKEKKRKRKRPKKGEKKNKNRKKKEERKKGGRGREGVERGAGTIFVWCSLRSFCASPCGPQASRVSQNGQGAQCALCVAFALNRAQFHQKTPQEREERMNIVAEKGKKAKFWSGGWGSGGKGDLLTNVVEIVIYKFEFEPKKLEVFKI